MNLTGFDAVFAQKLHQANTILIDDNGKIYKNDSKFTSIAQQQESDRLLLNSSIANDSIQYDAKSKKSDSSRASAGKNPEDLEFEGGSAIDLYQLNKKRKLYFTKFKFKSAFDLIAGSRRLDNIIYRKIERKMK